MGNISVSSGYGHQSSCGFLFGHCREENENPFVWVSQSQSQLTVNCNSEKNLGVGGVTVTLAFGSDGEIPVTNTDSRRWSIASHY